MPAIYEQYAPYRPELTAGEQKLLDASSDLRQTEIKIGMDRAEAQLREWPYPESQDTSEKFPGIDPKDKMCDVDMGFFERFTRLQTTLPSRPPEVREYVGGVLDQLKDRESVLSQSWTAMTDDCAAIRRLNRGAKLAPTAEASEEMLQDAAKRSTELASIQQIDGFLNAMEYAAGISGKVPDGQARDFLESKLNAPIPAKVEAVRTAPNTTPAALNVYFQDFDHVAAQQFCSAPENWGKTPEDMPPDFKETGEALPVIDQYAPATVDRALQPVFEKLEYLEESIPAKFLDRGGLITVDGKTVRTLMEESYKGDPNEFGDWYKKNVREMTSQFVSSGLMSGKRVEAFIPDADGKLPKEPVQITKSGYEPSPLKKVTLNAWERYFAKHGHYKKKAAKAAEYQRVMEGREQMRTNYMSGYLSAQILSSTKAENLFFSEYKQEVGGSTDMKLSDAIKQHQTSEAFRISRSAPVTTCICHLAAQGHSIQDIMNPSKLQAERQAAGRLYMEKAFANDISWLGETFFHGMDALTKQAREILSRYDLTNRESTLTAMPEANPVLNALFDASQEMGLKGTHEAFYLAAEKAHPGKGIEYGERVCDMADGAARIGDIVRDELKGCVNLAHPTGAILKSSLTQIAAGAGMREIMKNSSEPDPLLRVNLQTYGALTTSGMYNSTVLDMADRLEEDPAARRAIAHLAHSGQLQDKIHVGVKTMTKQDGKPLVMNVTKRVRSLVQGEDGQLHLKIEDVSVSRTELDIKVTPSKSLEARMEKQQKAHEFQAKHQTKESKKDAPRKEAPQKPAPKKQTPAKSSGGRTK